MPPKEPIGGILAHGRNQSGSVHLLQDHLTATAGLCSEYSDAFGFSTCGYLLGYWHDIGKIHPEWQDYLQESEETVKDGKKIKGPNHAPVGACRSNAAALGPLAMVIAAHHMGLVKKTSFANNLNRYASDDLFKEGLQLWEKYESSEIRELIEQAKTELAVIQEDAQYPDIKKKPHRQASRLEFAIRFLLSALVDADRLETEAHYESYRHDLRKAKPALKDLYGKLARELQRLSELANDTKVNRVRRKVLEACKHSALAESGIFRLTAPTGAGKTLSSLTFALKHAIHNDLRRIIVAIPYTSIIDQTVQTFRKIFGHESVLEHHSAIREREKLADESIDRLQLATENWDYPLIVTTTNQLFESLFGNHPSRIRKIHNLAQSVIIVDEFQTIPCELLEPTLEAIRQLTDHYGATFLLSTATQPAVVGNKHFEGLDKVHEILPDAEVHFAELRRVRYKWPKAKQSWDEIAVKMHGFEQVLTIVNTKKHAIQLLDTLQDEKVLHLSTQLCGAHRREVLDEINHRLEIGESCKVVSTQVVEAGVDLDFPVVMRAIGPLDRIIQAAGRCNREGKLNDLGRVIVFTPEDNRVPSGSYRSGTDEARKLISAGDLDPDNPTTFERYFSLLYRDIELDANKIEEKRSHFDYPQVAEKYRFISEETRPVVITNWHPDKIDRTLNSIRNKLDAGYGPSREDFRALQPYIVNLYPNQYKACADLIDDSIPGLAIWLGSYDSVRGLVTESLKAEDLIF